MAEFKLREDATSVPGKDSRKAPKGAVADEDATFVPGQGSRPARKGKGKGKEQDTSLINQDLTYHRMRLRKGDEVNVYAKQRDEALAMDARARHVIGLAILTVVVILVAILIPNGIFTSQNAGTTTAEWMDQIRNRSLGLVSLITLQGGDYSMDAITFHFLIVALAGAALGVSGGIYQGTLKNALASPSTLGVMSGANIGRIVYVLFFYQTVFLATGSGYLHASEINAYYDAMAPLDYVWAVYGQVICCLVGSLAVVALVLGIAQAFGHGRPAKAVMVIAGQVIAQVISVVSQAIAYYFSSIGDSRFDLVRELQQSSFSNTFRLLDLVLMGVPVLLIIGVLMTQTGKINLLSFGDAEARSMGLNVSRTRWIVVGGCTAMTAIVVAFCGQVGFVGFLIPHFVRKLVGPDFRYLIPASAFAGATFLVGSYFVISLFDSGVAMSLNMFTSTVGIIAFLAMALAQRGKSRGEWI